MDIMQAFVLLLEPLPRIACRNGLMLCRWTSAPATSAATWLPAVAGPPCNIPGFVNGGPKDHIDIRILYPGSKPQDKWDSRNHALWDLYVYVLSWALMVTSSEVVSFHTLLARIIEPNTTRSPTTRWPQIRTNCGLMKG